MKSEMLHPSGTGAPVQFLSGSGANRLFNLLYRLNVNYTSLRKPMLFLFLLALSLTSTLKISAQCNPGGPITTAPALFACPGTLIEVPVTVASFNGVGAISLTLNYDNSKMTFSSYVNTSGLIEFCDATVTGSVGTITISGMPYPVASLANGAILITLKFNYINGNTDLIWNDEPPTLCEYGSGPPEYQPFCDAPKGNFYINGSVTASPIPTTVYVDGNYNALTPGWQCDRFNKIQDGINRVELGSGGKVQVYAGIYTEQIRITKSIDLIGYDGYSNTTILAPATGRSTFNGITGVGTNWVSDYILAAYPADWNGATATGTPITVYLSGFTLDANNQVHQAGSDRFTGVFFGCVKAVNSIDAGFLACEIKGFNVLDNSATGVNILGDSKLTIGSSTIRYTLDGIAVAGDNSTNPDPEVEVGLNTVDYLQATSTGADEQAISMVLGATGIILLNQISNGVTGISLSHASNCQVKENTLSNLVSGSIGTGIKIFNSSSNNTITGNSVTNSDFGLRVNNGSNNNTFSCNTFTGNQIGAQIDANTVVPTGSSFDKNKFFANTVKGFINNTVTPVDVTLNYWGGAGLCPSYSGLVTYFPYYTTITGTCAFGGLIYNNVAASATATSICYGSSTTIYATGGTEYIWSHSLGMGSNKVVNPLATTIYTVTASDVNGCPGATPKSVTITVNPLPDVKINGLKNGSISIATGSPYVLTASGGATAYSYLWDNSETAAVRNVLPQANTMYTVMGYNANCSDYTNFTVNVASISAGSNKFICLGGNTTLEATCSGITSPTYLWSQGGTTATISVSPIVTSNYTVTVTGTNTWGSAGVTVFVRPKPLANAGLDISFPSGGSGILIGSASNGSAPYSYLWAGTGIVGSPATKNITVNQAGTFSLTVTDGYGCVSLPDEAVATIPVGGNVVGGNISYYGTINPQMHNVTITLTKWGESSPVYTGITPASGTSNYEIAGVETGIYRVNFSLATAWGGVTSADIMAIQKHYTAPMVPLVGLKRLAADVVDNSSAAIVNVADKDKVNAKMKAPNSSANQFATGNWVFTNALSVLVNTAPFFYANSSGFSSIAILVGPGSVTYNFKSLCYGDVNGDYNGYKEFDDQGFELTNGNDLKILCFPNPFNTYTTLQYSLPVEGDVSITVYNMLGTQVAKIDKPQQPEGASQVRWDATGLPAGMYMGVVTLKTSDDILRQQVKMLLTK